MSAPVTVDDIKTVDDIDSAKKFDSYSDASAHVDMIDRSVLHPFGFDIGGSDGDYTIEVTVPGQNDPSYIK